MKSALRRVSTQPDGGEASASPGELRTIKRTFSTAAAAESSTLRRASLATISSSLRLGRSSKKAQSTSTPSSTATNRLGQLFFSLPNELHALVLSFVEPRDILSLRLTCHITQSILDLCAHQILTTHLPQIVSPTHVPHILRLYPPPLPNLSLSHYLRLLPIHTITTQTTNLLTSFMQMKIYMLPPTRQHQRITSLTDTRSALLASHLYPALWTINHYLTFHRDLLIHAHSSHSTSTDTPSKRSRLWTCLPCGEALTSLIASYPPETLLPTYQAMRLLQIHLRASSRAPSYAGTIERVVRRWSRRPAGEEELSVAVLLGGLEVLRKVTVLRGTYSSRLEVLRGFLEGVEGAVEENGGNKVGMGTSRMVVGRKGGTERVQMMGGELDRGRNSVGGEVAGKDDTGCDDGDGDTSRRQTTSPSPDTHGTLNGNSKRKGKGRESEAAGPPPPTSSEVAPPSPTHSSSFSSSLPASPSLSTRLLTPTTLAQVPSLLEDIFLPELRRRIETEGLLVEMLPHPDDQEEELETPYHWVRRVICGEEEDGEEGEEEGVGEGADEGRELHGDGEREADGDREREETHEGRHLTWTGTGIGTGPGTEAVMGVVHQQQQQQPVAAIGNAMRTGTGMFGSMSRHMLVSVGRRD